MKIQLGIDIGGTTVSIGGVLETQLVFAHSVWLAKGCKPLVEQIVKLWKWAMEQAGEREVELSLGIGCPGTWVDGKILPGTALNLETYSGEMDKTRFETIKPQEIKVRESRHDTGQ